MNKDSAPLYERMVIHTLSGQARFHVPGHKGGKRQQESGETFLAGVMAVDYTEIPGLDDLHRPEGVIREAQELAADCFGAEETFFLVGGSTAGNLAMILAVCGPGDLLIVQRNAHKSVIHGLMLAGARAVFLPPRWDEGSGLATGVRAEDVREALRRHPDAKGVFVTNPNYYGMGIDLAPVADAAHGEGVPLLVDEAHGAHFGFHSKVPRAALSSGADAAVQSTHKTLDAMTMGAMLHVQGTHIDRGALRERLAMIQSSSPSYPIMASLDLCRRELHTQGAAYLEPALLVSEAMRTSIGEQQRFGLVEHRPGHAEYDTLDPFKITLYDRTGTLTGFRLQQELAAEGCIAEMADPRHVVLTLGPGSSMEDADRFRLAISNIYGRFSSKKQENARAASNKLSNPLLSEISFPVSFPSNPRSGHLHGVRLQESAGRRSAEMVIPYPPGIPVLYPGETITEQALAHLMRLAEAGARFQGVHDTTLASISVYQDTAGVPE